MMGKLTHRQRDIVETDSKSWIGHLSEYFRYDDKLDDVIIIEQGWDVDNFGYDFYKIKCAYPDKTYTFYWSNNYFNRWRLKYGK